MADVQATLATLGLLGWLVNPTWNANQVASTRPLNTPFQISPIKAARVHYAVQITCTSSISSGQAGDVFLEMASDQAFTQNVQQIAQFGNSQTFTLAVALQGVQALTGTMSALIPPGYWVRIRTANTLGTPTFAYMLGQETFS